MLKTLRILGYATAFAATATALHAEDVTIATARGEVTLPANPPVIAVLDVAAIDTLTALGVEIAGVPDRLYVNYLDAVGAKATTVGTLFEPDLEALAGIGPELIIAGGRSAGQVDALNQLSPTIDMTIWEDLVPEARARISAYGALFGKADAAAKLVADLDAKIAAVQATSAGKGRALILLTNGPKVAAYGKGSRFSWIHDVLEIPEARENLDPQTHGDAVSFEFIAEVNPDWIILIDRSTAVGEPASAASTLDNPLVQGTTAGQKGQIIALSAAPVYIAGGGYTSLMTTLDELLKGFGG